jgi:2-oxoglutarate dehydrogenase E1 component
MSHCANKTSAYLGGDIRYLTTLYLQFLNNPQAVDASVAAFFKDLGDDARDLLVQVEGPSWTPTFKLELTDPLAIEEAPKAQKSDSKGSQASAPGGITAQQLALALKTLQLIEAHRQFGHLAVQLDPLGLQAPAGHPELEPSFYGITAQDMDVKIQLAPVFGDQTLTVGQALTWVKGIYTNGIGYDYAHITDSAKRQWLAQHLEHGIRDFAPNERLHVLEGLTKAEQFERFLSVKFPGAKRFGLEGGDSMVPLLETVLAFHAAQGTQEAVIGMAHRGRLNVLTNVMNKPYGAVFNEFKYGVPVHSQLDSSGDVKYHMGVSTDRSFNGHPMHLTLMPNPSHLEAVNPVAMGKVRGRLDDLGTGKALCVLIHGDAAFAGQGLVAECLAMSSLAGYSVGGTFHIVINNQVGFTTNPVCSRSSKYTTDVAKGLDIPVLHVNGDDPEAVVRAGWIACEYRKHFNSDVIIDLVCYRRNGHNEMDEPAFTQPKMYGVIGKHPTPRVVYVNQLMSRGLMAEEQIEALKTQVEADLAKAFDQVDDFKNPAPDWLKGRWSKIKVEDDKQIPVTGVALDLLKKDMEALTTVPEGFGLNPKIARSLEQKKQAMTAGEGLDWSMGEALAFSSLLREGHKVRLSGQDCQRGTFTHRHSVWTDQETEKEFSPFNPLTQKPQQFEVVNSLLSEYAVLGYEYGYAYNSPDALVIWEAQFGDFANGAQIIIDQYVSAGESKWLRKNGMVLLLPHGYEGQGPEHSSARLERFLQLCAQNNMRVVNCTTPANIFHVLRRQVHSQTRKPLIVMTPKSLLRLKAAVSPLADLGATTAFRPVIAEGVHKDVERVVFCSGKVYYDLAAHMETAGLNSKVALVRLEQLYPFPEAEVAQMLSQVNSKAKRVWCQEEPANMGAWSFVAPRLAALGSVIYAGRPEAASPATGSDKIHAKEQQMLVELAVGG